VTVAREELERVLVASLGPLSLDADAFEARVERLEAAVAGLSGNDALWALAGFVGSVLGQAPPAQRKVLFAGVLALIRYGLETQGKHTDRRVKEAGNGAA
jgi:hypothetical protein